MTGQPRGDAGRPDPASGESTRGETARGDADIAEAARLFAEPARARILVALADGRALPASMLASEAGVSPATASSHLRHLLRAGLVVVEPTGRHRYYRLAGPDVAAVLESLAQVAPTQPVRSLRQATRAQAFRAARTCYDHLAGRLGVALTSALVEHGALTRIEAGTDRLRGDDRSGPVRNHPYVLGPKAAEVLGDLGVDLDALRDPTSGDPRSLNRSRSRRPLLRFCTDWTERRHHLAGRLGAALAASLFEREWVVRRPHQRAVRLTDRGADGLRRTLGLTVDV